MPKSTSRGPGLRAHSRSSSATKLGANLQFTQPAPAVQPAGAPAQKGKKATGHVEALAHPARAAPPFHRANSAQRVHSREQIAKRLAPLHQQHPPPARQPQQQQTRADKKGFSIANPSEDGEDDDDWESSESGAATPNHDDSGSDTASEDGLDPALLNLQISAHPRAPHPHHQQQKQQQQIEREQQQQLEQQQRQYEIEQQQRQRELDHQQHLQQQQQQQQQLYQRQLYLQQQQALQQQQQSKQQQQHPYQPPQHQLQSDLPQTHDTGLIRVNTVRPSDFEQALHPQRIKTPRPPSPPHRQQHQQNQPSAQQQRQQQPQTRRQRSQERQDQRPHSPPPPSQQPAMERRPQPSRRESDPARESVNGKDTSRTQRSPRSHKSRPPSTHSNTSRSEHLRPHPLFRGLSHGQVNTSKPAPLAPLTVVPTNSNELSQISHSPQPDSATGRYFLSSSPTSLRTSSGSPGSVGELPHSASHPFPFPTSQHHDRRTSFSSARSVNTVPAHAGILASRDIAPWTHERTRTLSTMSTASSSAALSSLANIPTATRPPSPQSIAFFPPVNPHANVGAIHPLLPGPYLHNHLTVLARRTPIRESFDRVIRAKNARQAA